jgi:hypothetical protein
MAEDPDKDAPSLEPPSLFGRKKKTPKAPKAARPTRHAEPAEPAAAAPTEPDTLVSPRVDTRVDAPADPSVDAPLAPDDGPSTIFDDTSEPTPDPDPVPAAVQVAAPRESKPPREPWLAGRPAAIVTGLLVGAAIVAATAGSLRICTKVKGTSSCGGPGFFLLVAILIVAVLLGAAMLRAAAVPEPGSTSFLAVGLLSVVTLLFLVGSIFQWWMIIVIPLVSVATFLLSHWVTTTYIDPAALD